MRVVCCMSSVVPSPRAAVAQLRACLRVWVCAWFHVRSASSNRHFAVQAAQNLAKSDAARRAWWLSYVEDARMVGLASAVEARLVQHSLQQEIIQPTHTCVDIER